MTLYCYLSNVCLEFEVNLKKDQKFRCYTNPDDKEPRWLTNKIKKNINEKSTVFKHYRQNGNNFQILNKLKFLQNLVTK